MARRRAPEPPERAPQPHRPRPGLDRGIRYLCAHCRTEQLQVGVWCPDCLPTVMQHIDQHGHPPAPPRP